MDQELKYMINAALIALAMTLISIMSLIGLIYFLVAKSVEQNKTQNDLCSEFCSDSEAFVALSASCICYPSYADVKEDK